MPAKIDRRLLLGAGAALATCPTWALAAGHRPMARVIVDNDFAGDPDGLFALAHHLLCGSVTIPLIVSSNLPVQFGGPTSAADGKASVADLLKVLGRPDGVPVLAGAEAGLSSRQGWKASPATAAIVREAMREDTQTPLFYAAGASLTELALAWLSEPRIGRRLKLVWIGGNEHPGLAVPPPGPAEDEFNYSIDRLAAQIIFNESDIEIWQVPRNAYRQMLMPTAAIADLAQASRLGAFLQGRLDAMEQALAKIPGFPPMAASEVYVLGDSPLVTLTALMTPLQSDPASSPYQSMPTPRIEADGTYRRIEGARPMRVFTAIDAALTFQDMAFKFRKAT